MFAFQGSRQVQSDLLCALQYPKSNLAHEMSDDGAEPFDS